MDKKKIIVTGGAGLVGSHLCERLLAEGNHVICIDSLLSGNGQGLKLLTDNPSFEMIHHNVVVPFNVEADQIYALASPSSPDYFVQYPAETLKINLQGTINSLEIARRFNVPILLASSADVYGNSRLPLQSEGLWGNVNPLSARSSIEEGKRAAESLMKAYHSEYKVNTKIARLFNVYGPHIGANDSRVLPKFVVSALMGRDIVIYGNGMQTRSFCYVTDVVEAMIRLMNATPDTFITPINIGTNHEITILDLARKIILMTGSRSKIIHVGAVNDEPRSMTPDISRARQILDWEPTTSLETGLHLIVEYVEALLKEKANPPVAMSWVEMG